MSIISRIPFQDESAAFEYLEKTLWPEGPVCPHCGTVDTATKLAPAKPNGRKRQARMGLWKCNEKECRKQFTVKVGTVFEHGRIPLHKMLQAVYLLCCSKKGISSHQLHRILQIQYKSAWFLSHRIREAMRDGSLAPLGGTGKTVEIDQTGFGLVGGSWRARLGMPTVGWVHLGAPCLRWWSVAVQRVAFTSKARRWRKSCLSFAPT